MYNTINELGPVGNQWLNFILLCFALSRIYLEIIQFDFASLPLTKGMFKSKEDARRFHRSGLYLCIGYILFSAPIVLMS
jgi:hypothetical protein